MTFDPDAFIRTGGEGCSLIPLGPKALEDWCAAADAGQRRWVETAEFAARKAEVLALPDAEGGAASVLVGLGDETAVDTPDPWLWAAVAEGLPGGTYRLPEDLGYRAAHAAALGWALAQYRYDRYRSTPEPARPRILNVADAVARRGAISEAAAVALVRDLVNTPTNDMGPAALAETARGLAADHGAEIEVTEGEALLERNLPAIHAVGRAAADAPRLIDLRWGREDAPKLSLVGKGVCFDSGGLDIKAASGMRLMKKDMGGAAHVLGLAKLVMETGLDVRLRVLIPAVENAISSNAYRPGDVIATRKGVTVEVGNTDAEGRLVLADALALADEEEPVLLLDFATLTGAARVALGPDLPAFFTPDHGLAEDAARAALETGDPLWRLPLWKPYFEDLASPVADIANVAEDGFAGAILAALFLERFVSRADAWGHFDIYAWNRKARPGRPQGGEAMALRASFAMLQSRFLPASRRG